PCSRLARGPFRQTPEARRQGRCRRLSALRPGLSWFQPPAGRPSKRPQSLGISGSSQTPCNVVVILNASRKASSERYQSPARDATAGRTSAVGRLLASTRPFCSGTGTLNPRLHSPSYRVATSSRERPDVRLESARTAIGDAVRKADLQEPGETTVV